MSVAAPPAPPPDPDATIRAQAPEPQPAAPATTGGGPPADPTRWAGWGVVADLVGLGALGLIAVSGFAPAFGGSRWLVVGGLGLATGLVIGLVGARRPLPLWLIAVITVLVGVVVGPSLVQPDAVVALVVPTPRVAADVVVGAFQGWPNLLTTTVPVGAAQNLLVVPWAASLVAGVVAMSTSRRAGTAGVALLAVLPMVALLVGGIVVGTDAPAWPLQATAFALVALVWGAGRQRASRSSGMAGRGRRRILSGALVLLLVGALGLVLGRSALVSGPSERFVARDHVEPPVDLRRLPSPLEGFRRLRTEERRDDVLFTVDGLEPGDRLRLATLDDYDGTIWHVQEGSTDPTSSGFFERVGQELPVTVEGEARTVEVEVGDYEGAWVPTVGATAQVVFEGERATDLSEGFRYNRATDTAAEPDGLRPGDRYRLEAVLADENADLLDGTGDPGVQVPEPAPVEGLAERIGDLSTGDLIGASPLRRTRAVETWFRSEGVAVGPGRAYFSDGALDVRDTGDAAPPSRPGHSAERMRTFLDEEGYVIGNEEQFASAMALIAHELGLPARVVVGFAPDLGEDADGPVEVTGADVSAWTEVAVQGVGWIPLDPTPVDLEVPIDETPERVQPPDRYVEPPPVTVPQVDLPSGARSGSGCVEDCGDEGAGGGSSLLPAWAATAAKVVVPPIALLVLATAVMAGLKGRRRRRRRRRGPPGARVAAAWSDICDLARDLGDAVPAVATRREVAVLLGRPGVADLARSADALVFGPEEVTPAAAEGVWRDADAARAAMVGSLGPLGRWKALVNPTSLRRRR